MEHTHTNKIIYLTIGVVLAIIAVLGVVTFFNKKEAGPSAGTKSGQTTKESMTASGVSRVPPEERTKTQAEMTASGKSRISPAEQEKSRKAMTGQ